MLDNAWDFLNDHYPNSPKEDRKIAVTIKVDLKPEGEKKHTSYSGTKFQCG